MPRPAFKAMLHDPLELSVRRFRSLVSTADRVFPAQSKLREPVGGNVFDMVLSIYLDQSISFHAMPPFILDSKSRRTAQISCTAALFSSGQSVPKANGHHYPSIYQGQKTGKCVVRLSSVYKKSKIYWVKSFFRRYAPIAYVTPRFKHNGYYTVVIHNGISSDYDILKIYERELQITQCRTAVQASVAPRLWWA